MADGNVHQRLQGYIECYVEADVEIELDVTATDGEDGRELVLALSPLE